MINDATKMIKKLTNIHGLTFYNIESILESMFENYSKRVKIDLNLLEDEFISIYEESPNGEVFCICTENSNEINLKKIVIL